jgi:hypothetical protein
MERRGDEVHVESTEATGASKEGVVRWVLIIGTLLAIVLLSAVWITGAAFQGDVEEEANVSQKIDSTERDQDDTDSMVSDRVEQVDTTIDPAAGAAQSEPGSSANTAPQSQPGSVPTNAPEGSE